MKCPEHGVQRRCPECGQKFIQFHRGCKKFCSADCQRRNWVVNNRASHNKAVREYRKRRYQTEGRWQDEGPKAKALRAWMIELKSCPCKDCGNKFPACCMDFDHARGTKKFNVGSMFAHHYSRKLIEHEIKKCDLVCSNCHRIRTQKRKLGTHIKA